MDVVGLFSLHIEDHISITVLAARHHPAALSALLEVMVGRNWTVSLESHGVLSQIDAGLCKLNEIKVLLTNKAMLSSAIELKLLYLLVGIIPF